MSNYKPSAITLMLDLFEAIFDGIIKLFKKLFTKNKTT
jgi:hypothetical protein